MKKKLALLLLLSFGAAPLMAQEATPPVIGHPGSGFYVGQSSFPRGDSIEITSVEQSSDHLIVKGHYSLVSTDYAQLAIYTTTREAISVPTARTQSMQIFRGAGDFELIDPNQVLGLNHVSMYAGGHPFGGVYFGSKEDALAESKLKLDYYSDKTSTAPAIKSASTAGPNQALLEYLGDPVSPPANLDSRYTATGLTDAIDRAARNSGVSCKKVTVDDSEFPALVAVVCAGSDFGNLKDALKQLSGYAYTGSIGNDINSDGSDTCNAFSLVPDSVYPARTARQIYHRLWLRQQVFYDRVNPR